MNQVRYRSTKLRETLVLQPQMSSCTLADTQTGLQIRFKEDRLATNVVETKSSTHIHLPYALYTLWW